MKYAMAVAAVVLAFAGCAQMQRMTGMGWETLVDGDKGLENFNRVGDANWRAEGGAIVDVAAVPVPIANKAGGRWNTYEITAKGEHMLVRLNGVTTVQVDENRMNLASGPFGLQYALGGSQGAQGGPIKWRKVQIRPL